MKICKLFLAASLVLVLITAWSQASFAQLGDSLKISSVKQVGRTIELTDGSIWSIENPDDQEIAYRWLPYQDISVLNGNELRNNHTGQRIDAKMVQKATATQAAAVPSSTPTYSVQVEGKPGPGPATPAARQPAADLQLLDKILKRLDSLEAKIQVMDLRLRKIEKESLGKP